jgi:hypothetical protein
MTKESVQRFNLQTMSGVFPGTRTPVFQRVQIEQVSVPRPDSTPAGKEWLQLAWYDEPTVCVAYAIHPGQPFDYAQPVVQLTEPLTGDFNQRLQMVLAAQEQQMISCGSCRFWQQREMVTSDQLPLGTCSWHRNAAQADALPASLALQSMLALPCPHWQSLPPSVTAAPAVVSTADRQSLTPMRKAAESAEIRLTHWQRLKKQVVARYWVGKTRDWQSLLQERSGVGAGTEACFACQGRLANLGALTVGTPEGDKQTFSIWRCRLCYTLYLNNWIDRWERLDNLETEETYYRLAPAEAKELLMIIYGVVGGEHPNRRQERQAERTHFLNFIQDRSPLSHQIRQGR